MAHVAQAAGLGRESLYKTLAPGARPRFSTVQAILRALNVCLTLQAPTKLAKANRKEMALKAFKARIEDVDALKAAAKRAAPAKKRA